MPHLEPTPTLAKLALQGVCAFAVFSDDSAVGVEDTQKKRVPPASKVVWVALRDFADIVRESEDSISTRSVVSGTRSRATAKTGWPTREDVRVLDVAVIAIVALEIVKVGVATSPAILFHALRWSLRWRTDAADCTMPIGPEDSVDVASETGAGMFEDVRILVLVALFYVTFELAG
ncbi:unnamed protein product [Peniophora sp. CBMAI 1063]|nr:unnamed protein product [Peniophora sp. CBMAI 1063]